MTEAELHEAVADWLDANLPGGWLHHCTESSAGQSRKRQADFWKRGVRPGFPDHIVIAPLDSGLPPLISIELKVGSNKPTDNQEEMHRHLRDLGHAVGVCYSLADVEAYLRECGVPLPDHETCERRYGVQQMRKREAQRERQRSKRRKSGGVRFERHPRP